MNYIIDFYNYLTILGWTNSYFFWYAIWNDKFIHFSVISLIWILLLILLSYIFSNKYTILFINIIILLIISVWKEFFDLLIRKTVFGYLDILADLFWILFIVTFYLIIKKSQKKS